MKDLKIYTMSDFDNYDSIDALDELLKNGGVTVPDKKDGNTEKKEKESSGMKPGKGKVSPGRGKPADRSAGVFPHTIYLTRREFTLLRLISSLSGKSMSIVVSESLAVGIKKFESWLTKRGVSNIDRFKEDFDKEF